MRYRNRRSTALTVMVAVLGVLAAGGLTSGGSALAAAPRQEAPASVNIKELPLCEDLPDLPTARCGQVTVPLDRSHPARGTIEVAYAFVPHTEQDRPSLGTIVPNPGGPGSSTIDFSGGSFAQGLEPLLDRRDLLLIDPRGVGRSGALTCPALTGSERAFAGVAEQRRLIGKCGRQLGARVAYYGTAAVADDFDDVRQALGIEKLDLLGVSYGTFLMPTYASRYPDRVRTITLAGAYAVNIPSVGSVDVAAFRRAVTLVCQRTGQCSGRRVLSDLAALADRLRHRPTTVDVAYEGRTHRMVLDEKEMTTTAAAVYTSAPDEDAQLALVRAAAAGRRGDLEPLKEMVRSRVTALASNLDLGPGIISDALSWAATCHDYPRDFSYASSRRARVAERNQVIARYRPAQFAPFSPKAWLSRADYDTGACLQWPNDPTARSPFPAGTRLPNVPVLVLSGDLDANTSSASGREAAAQFLDSTFIEVPGAGHTPASTPEGVRFTVDFIAGGGFR